MADLVHLVDSKLKEVHETIRTFRISKDDYTAKLNDAFEYCEKIEQESANGGADGAVEASELTDRCRVLKTTISLALRVETPEPSFRALLFGQGHPSFPPKNTRGACGKLSTSMASILENFEIFGALESSAPQLEEDSEEDVNKLEEVD